MTGCSKSYTTKEITYKVNDDWNCSQDKNGLFCKIVEQKAAFSMFYIDTNDNEELGIVYSIDDYIENIPTTATWLEYEFTLNEKVNIDTQSGKNIIYYTKAKDDDNDTPIINNEYVFKYNKRIYIFQYYTYDDVNAEDKDRLYEKYLQDFKDIIKSIKIK